MKKKRRYQEKTWKTLWKRTNQPTQVTFCRSCRRIRRALCPSLCCGSRRLGSAIGRGCICGCSSCPSARMKPSGGWPIWGDGHKATLFVAVFYIYDLKVGVHLKLSANPPTCPLMNLPLVFRRVATPIARLQRLQRQWLPLQARLG